MKIAGLIDKSLTESKEYVSRAIKGLSADELAFQVKPYSNSIAFLLWHMARVEDLWINKILMGGKEIYELEDWYKKFGTPEQDSGFGYDIKKLQAWPIPKLDLLQAYAFTVRGKTQDYLNTLNEKALDDPKDFGWSKGTVGSALSHLITEVGEHTGQIGYIRGIMKGIEASAPPPKK